MPEDAAPAFEWWYENGIPETIVLGLKVRKLHAETTRYQNLEIFEQDHLGRILVLDRFIQATQADEFVYHEMLVQVPLVGRRRSGPISVLIIGGGDGACLREALRHAWVERVVMVEIDEAVIRRSIQYLGIHGDYDDPRVELIIGDGAAYVTSSSGRERLFDVVLVDCTDPGGPSEVLYSKEFYLNIKNCLTADGVFCQQMGVPAYERDVLGREVHRLRDAFGNAQVYRAAIPTYIGGDLAFALATLDGHACSKPQFEFTGRYYNGMIHSAAFALPTWWRERIEGGNQSSRI